MSATPEINRANSQNSTGPSTEAGKQRSSLNALRHGLTSRIAVMPSEDLEAYQAHLKTFTDDYQPQGATETHLVQVLADTSWRQNRIVAIESNVLRFATMTLMADNDSKVLANLSLHSHRLARQFERTVELLRVLQGTRQAKERQDLDKVLDMMETCESKGETYNPAGDGFVFSPSQITRAIRLRNRDRLASKARAA
jgi:cysteinyl-tRNA synthetase